MRVVLRMTDSEKTLSRAAVDGMRNDGVVRPRLEGAQASRAAARERLQAIDLFSTQVRPRLRAARGNPSAS